MLTPSSILHIDNSHIIQLEELARQLNQRQWGLVVADAAFGGLFSCLVHQHVTLRRHLKSSYVIHDPLSLNSMLNIIPESIGDHGELEPSVGSTMARNALHQSNAHFAVVMTTAPTKHLKILLDGTMVGLHWASRTKLDSSAHWLFSQQFVINADRNEFNSKAMQLVLTETIKALRIQD